MSTEEKLEAERRALSPSPARAGFTRQVPRAGTLGDYDGDAQARSLQTHLSTLEGMGNAEVSFGGLPRNDRDRLPPREVVTEEFFPLPYEGKPGPDASPEEIKAWNVRTRSASPEELMRMMCLSPWMVPDLTGESQIKAGGS